MREEDAQPRRFELLYVPSHSIERYYVARPPAAPLFRYASWRGIEPGDWDLSYGPLATRPKQKAFREHFVDGVPWADTIIYDYVRERIARRGVFNGCRSETDILERYRKVDRLYQRIRADGRVKAPWELDGGARGNRDAIRVHLNRNGKLLFAGRGNHRLAIAQALDLDRIPVGLVVAHPDAVRDGHLSRLRRECRAHLKEIGLNPPKGAFGLRRNRLMPFLPEIIGQRLRQ